MSLDFKDVPRYPKPINVSFIEKAYSLFLSRFPINFDVNVPSCVSISPISILEILNGKKISDLHQFETSKVKSIVLLHYLPECNYFVCCQRKSDKNATSLSVYVPSTDAQFIKPILVEWLSQVEKIFSRKADTVVVCCPQDSQPYFANHSVLSLATFQVLMQHADPCKVTFLPGELRDSLKKLSHERPLLEDFKTTSKKKTSKSVPWFKDFFDVNEIVNEDFGDNSEDENQSGNFTTMVSPINFVSQVEIENELKWRKKKMSARDILSVAPSESETPRNVLLDDGAEELSAPHLFLSLIHI